MRTLFLFLALIFITSCTETEYITMIYEETHCSDAWNSYKTDDNRTEEAVIEFFQEIHDIELKDVTIKTVDTGPFCYACNCLSGREIEVSIDEKLVNKMENEGFVRK